MSLHSPSSYKLYSTLAIIILVPLLTVPPQCNREIWPQPSTKVYQSNDCFHSQTLTVQTYTHERNVSRNARGSILPSTRQAQLMKNRVCTRERRAESRESKQSLIGRDTLCYYERSQSTASSRVNAGGGRNRSDRHTPSILHVGLSSQ